MVMKVYVTEKLKLSDRIFFSIRSTFQNIPFFQKLVERPIIWGLLFGVFATVRRFRVPFETTTNFSSF